MSVLRVYGDCHGKINRMANSFKDSGADYGLQIGDMGFDYSDLDSLDYNKFRFFRGNHDNTDLYYDCPHALGDFGYYTLGDITFFYIGGAFSIDWKQRKFDMIKGGYKSYWDNEQLSKSQMEDAFRMYMKIKPDIMITHSCPNVISRKIGNPNVLSRYGYDPDVFTTNTQELLQQCFDYHKPKIWIFGHMHRTLDFVFQGTRFLCLGELKYVDFIDGELVNNNKLDTIRQ